MELDVGSVGDTSVEETMEVIGTADIFIKAEEYPRKSVRKVGNISRMGNQGLEKINRLPISRMGRRRR
jgi:hypothetical protein